MSKAKNLAHHLGGKWKYDGVCGWHCDDGVRHVYRCSAGVDEWDNPLGPPEYWLYGQGTPKRAEEYLLSPGDEIVRLFSWRFK